VGTRVARHHRRPNDQSSNAFLMAPHPIHTRL
jgi:hypothetical protein